MSEIQTLYKLIVLAILGKADFALTNSQLSAFILEKQYTDYFTLQQTLADMVKAGYLQSEVIRNSTRYTITKKGRETLEYFGGEVSEAIKADIQEYLKKNRLKLQNENAVTADYRRSGIDFAVRLKVQEKDALLIGLELTVPLEEQAVSICDNWKDKSQQIYSYLMRELMQEARHS